MTVSAHDVAAVLRQRLPGLPIKKLHKLLYYCQGHHLANFDEPLFDDTISAWDMGPVVGTLWYEEKTGQPAEARSLTEAQLNTVGYVVSRYGALSGLDLERLTHAEDPWRTADRGRRRGESARIEREWIKQYFKATAATDTDSDEVLLDSDEVTSWLQDADQRLEERLTPDDPEKLRARLSSSA